MIETKRPELDTVGWKLIPMGLTERHGMEKELSGVDVEMELKLDQTDRQV